MDIRVRGRQRAKKSFNGRPSYERINREEDSPEETGGKEKK